ncbi:MAG: hypothetical protein ACREU7_09050 [Burkholderiales bacterium]
MEQRLKEDLRGYTVGLILEFRSEYLAAGASPLKHWTQLQDRIRAAARQSTDVPTWATAVARSLGLGAPTKDRSSTTAQLHDLVRDNDCAAQWLQMVEDEHAYLLAQARLIAEQQRARRTA